VTAAAVTLTAHSSRPPSAACSSLQRKQQELQHLAALQRAQLQELQREQKAMDPDALPAGHHLAPEPTL